MGNCPIQTTKKEAEQSGQPVPVCWRFWTPAVAWLRLFPDGTTLMLPGPGKDMWACFFLGDPSNVVFLLVFLYSTKAGTHGALKKYPESRSLPISQPATDGGITFSWGHVEACNLVQISELGARSLGSGFSCRSQPLEGFTGFAGAHTRSPR